MVMLRRPPAAVKIDGEIESVSRKLQPRVRPEVFKIIKVIGDSNYILGDIASGREVTDFKQPVHGDRLVLFDGGMLDAPIDKKVDIEVEGYRGVVKDQAWDGRIRVEMATSEMEDDFAYDYRNLGTQKDVSARGVWIDLEKFRYCFHESEPDQPGKEHVSNMLSDMFSTVFPKIDQHVFQHVPIIFQ